MPLSRVSLKVSKVHPASARASRTALVVITLSSNGAVGCLGGCCMWCDSAGLRPSGITTIPSVTRFTQSTMTAEIGNGMPSARAASMVSTSPPLVASR